jgi:hypothetical protein
LHFVGLIDNRNPAQMRLIWIVRYGGPDQPSPADR